MKNSKKQSMKRVLAIAMIASFSACGGSQESTTDAGQDNTTTEVNEKGNPSYDPNRGEGKFTTVEVGASLDVAMAQSGENISNVKCASCHKMTDERLVGPGWKGVTQRYQLTWLMNFITNPEPMIDKDPKLQAQLEICLVRMPNQNLSDQEARDIVEFMRKNDGVQ